MGDEEDFVIESADAGASATIPMEAGQIKKGGYVIIFGCVSADVVPLARSFVITRAVTTVRGGLAIFNQIFGILEHNIIYSFS
jgi:hypothetical protein